MSEAVAQVSKGLVRTLSPPKELVDIALAEAAPAHALMQYGSIVDDGPQTAEAEMACPAQTSAHPSECSNEAHSLEALAETVVRLHRMVEEQAKDLHECREEMRQAKLAGQVAEGKDEGEPDVDDWDGSADSSDVANLYSYCVEKLLGTPGLPPAHALVAVVLITLLICMQILYAYGFNDSSILLSTQQGLRAYSNPIHYSLWYHKSVIPHTAMPLTNFIGSICSLLFLAMLMKSDNEGTLLTLCPLESIMLPRPARSAASGADANAAEPSHLISATGRVGHMLLCTWLQFIWCCRSLLLPVLAGLGTAGAFAGATNAQDIVLNAVAIGFVFELDDFFYAGLLSRGSRAAFEETVPSPTSPLATAGRRELVSRWCWLIWCADSAFSIYFYSAWALAVNPTELSEFIVYDTQRYWIFVRAALMALGQMHLAVHSGRLAAGMSKARLAWGVIGLGVSIIAWAAVTITVKAVVLDAYFQSDIYAVIATPELMNCVIGQQPDGTECPSQLTDFPIPSFYDELGANSDAMLSAQERPTGVMFALHSAWGTLPKSQAFMDELGAVLAE